ncbi:MAG: hypothetical protein ACE3L7_23730 [Candidatus Pristimantibacillus sp.]
MKFEISDWVQGKAQNGELIQGYIETIDMMQGIIRVHVVKSDNESIMGRLVAVREQWLKKMPERLPDDSAQIHNLIDMALSTWDEPWFMELTEQLLYMNQAELNESNRSDQADESQLSTSI